MLKICLVCGYDNLEKYPWGIDWKTPTFDICPCCGVEFGYEDISFESRSIYFSNWITNEMPWFKKNLQPKTWLFEEQFENLDKFKLENKEWFENNTYFIFKNNEEITEVNLI